MIWKWSMRGVRALAWSGFCHQLPQHLLSPRQVADAVQCIMCTALHCNRFSVLHCSAGCYLGHNMVDSGEGGGRKEIFLRFTYFIQEGTKEAPRKISNYLISYLRVAEKTWLLFLCCQGKKPILLQEINRREVFPVLFCIHLLTVRVWI